MKDFVMKKPLKIILVIITVFASILVVLFSWHVWETKYYVPSGEGVWQSTSPDGRFTVVGYLTKGLLIFVPTAPGDGSSGPGVIVLKDNQTGEILQKARIDSVTALGGDEIKWDSSSVYVRYIDDWPLPPITNTKP
jgi:hypothetical protein